MDGAQKSYCVAIMIANGSQQWGRFAVTSNDRYYLDLIQPIFGTTVCSIPSHGGTSYRIRSASVSEPGLDDVTSPRDFIRAWAELKGGIQPITQHMHSCIRHVVGFKIYGPEHILQYIMDNAPIARKKIVKITNAVGDNYTGSTYCITMQKKDTERFLDYITGCPHNPAVWSVWDDRIKRIQNMDKKEAQNA